MRKQSLISWLIYKYMKSSLMEIQKLSMYDLANVYNIYQ